MQKYSRIFSTIIALMLVLSCVQVSAFASDKSNTNGTTFVTTNSVEIAGELPAQSGEISYIAMMDYLEVGNGERSVSGVSNYPDYYGGSYIYTRQIHAGSPEPPSGSQEEPPPVEVRLILYHVSI